MPDSHNRADVSVEEQNYFMESMKEHATSKHFILEHYHLHGWTCSTLLLNNNYCQEFLA